MRARVHVCGGQGDSIYRNDYRITMTELITTGMSPYIPRKICPPPPLPNFLPMTILSLGRNMSGMCVYVRVCVFVLRVCVCACVDACVYVCMFVLCVYMCVCVCVCVSGASVSGAFVGG